MQWRAIQKRGALKLQDFFWEWSHWSTGKNLTLHWCQYQQSNISSIFFCDMYFYQVNISYIVQYISTLAPGKICWAHGSNCYFSYRWLQNSSMFALSFLSHRSLSQSEQEEKKSCITTPPFFFLAQIESNPCGTKNPAPFKWCKCTRLYRGKPWVYEPSIEASTFCTCIRKCCSTNEQNIHGFFFNMHE